jgi:predicted transglutaminase-like cysteine proteinase
MNAYTTNGSRRIRPAFLAAAATMLVTVLATAGTSAGDTRTRFLAEGGPAKPTKAWTEFCAQNAEECRVPVTEQMVIPYSASVWNDLVKINTSVNRTIKAVTDEAYWGVSDRWDYPIAGYGDCEDIQLEKRRLLQLKGYPIRAMRMAVVINPEGEGHAVLVVRTSRGDFVLDNRGDQVLPWYATPYSWIKREGSVDETWVALGGNRGPTETADNQR